MKHILFASLLVFSLSSKAEDLETDQKFFNAVAAEEEDDLSSKVAPAKNSERHVQDEVTSLKTEIMSDEEARKMDDRVIAENKRRQAVILRELNQSAKPMQNCVSKNLSLDSKFKGGKATVIWMISPEGKILQSAIKNTDIDNDEIQRCIHRAAKAINFSEAKTDLLRKSLVEYTYKFNKKQRVVAKKSSKVQRKTASQ